MMKFIEYGLNENFDFGVQSEIGKLFLEDGSDIPEDYSGETWKFCIDINAIWNRYVKSEITNIELNQQYYKFLFENKSQILNFIEDKSEFENVLNEMGKENNPENFEKIWNKIYDICDKNEILLKT